jgi:hypothetical protein
MSEQTVTEVNGVWHVTDGNGMVVAGPFKTNAEAWGWVAWEEFPPWGLAKRGA